MWTVVLLSLLVAITIVDLRDLRIPDWANVALAVGGMAFLIVELSWPEGRSHIAAALIMAAGGWTIRTLYARLRGRQGLGLGDVKMLGAATLWVGPFGAPTLLLLATLSGLLTALAWHAIASLRTARGNPAGGMTAATRIPFGPHLAIGAAYAWLAGPV